MKHFCPRSHYRPLPPRWLRFNQQQVSTSTLFASMAGSQPFKINFTCPWLLWLNFYLISFSHSFFYLNPGFHPKWEEKWALTLKIVSTSGLLGYQSPAWWRDLPKACLQSLRLVWASHSILCILRCNQCTAWGGECSRHSTSNDEPASEGRVARFGATRP